MFIFTQEEINQAYKWLKRDVYYDKINLFLRKKIAEFEVGPDENGSNLENSLKEIYKDINQIDSLENKKLKDWLSKIDFRFLPKKLKNHEAKDNVVTTLITNMREEDSYNLDSVNYFADIPIQLHILAVLWVNYVGRILDDKCNDNCLGNRVENSYKVCKEKNIPQSENSYSFTLFTYYLPYYNRWRDTAIEVGLQNLKSKNDILLIAMDLKECFYNNELTNDDWKSINNEIENFYNNQQENVENKGKAILLNRIIKEINNVYTNKIFDYLKKTHFTDIRYKGNKNTATKYPQSVLPIGVLSSHVLNNWKLIKLDEKIINNLRPVYYGRYVDDILIIINQPKKELFKGNNDDKARIVLREYLQKTKILDKSKKEKIKGNIKEFFPINDYSFLCLQKEKLIFHYYDHKSSWAGLKNFKNELEKQASEFRFLPEESIDKELSDYAYEIQYEGSINVLRSVIGVKENSNKLVNFFFDQILKYWLTGEKLNKTVIDQIFRFFKGVNILNNFNTWERVFTLMIGTNETKNIKDLYCRIRETIYKINYFFDKEPFINQKVKDDLVKFLNISIEIHFNLLSNKELFKILDDSIWKFMKSENNDKQANYYFRETQLVRCQFVSWPLIEFIKDNTFSLCRFDIEKYINLENKNSKKIDFSFTPRLIYFNDYQMFQMTCIGLQKFVEKNLKVLINDYSTEVCKKNCLNINLNFSEDENEFDYENKIEVKNENENNENENNEDKDVPREEKKLCVDIVYVNEVVPREEKKLCVGVVNIKVPEENITAKLKPPRKSLSGERLQADLCKVLNESIRNPKCDLIIFPEVSIPIGYLSFLVQQARKYEVGIIFGAEHITTIENKTYNLVFTILPVRSDAGYKNVVIKARNKNHYAPKEEKEIHSYGMSLPQITYRYDLFSWRNCVFTVFNCYELSDIQQRCLFRSKIDLLIDISWNQDTHYYANILESAIRDIHCYAVNVNTSQFGDSRILLPKKTEKQNLVQITGGENCVLIKGILNIQELRDFQKHDFVETDKTFKPTPAGFDHDYVRQHRV